MALGARAASVVGSVLKGGARLVAIGIAVGLPIAWAASRWVESMLFGLTPNDPLTVVAAIAILVAAGELAAYLPARRASRVDPLTALRAE
jgi:putative ABC transport system permease protein